MPPHTARRQRDLHLQRGDVALDTATGAILLATAVNLVTKAGLALVAGGRAYGLPLAVATALGIAGGAVGFAIELVL